MGSTNATDHETAASPPETGRDNVAQASLTLGPGPPDADPGAALTPADRRAYRSGLRSDARRTTAYLASRGRTPIEGLHDMIRLGWPRGVEAIAARLKIPLLAANEIFERVSIAMLPYTASRIEEPRGNAAGAGPLGESFALAHYLAAARASDALERDRLARPMSPNRPFGDTSQVLEMTAENGAHTGQADCLIPTDRPLD